jgi:hypothetical protein
MTESHRNTLHHVTFITSTFCSKCAIVIFHVFHIGENQNLAQIEKLTLPSDSSIINHISSLISHPSSFYSLSFYLSTYEFPRRNAGSMISSLRAHLSSLTTIIISVFKKAPSLLLLLLSINLSDHGSRAGRRLQ